MQSSRIFLLTSYKFNFQYVQVGKTFLHFLSICQKRLSRKKDWTHRPNDKEVPTDLLNSRIIADFPFSFHGLVPILHDIGLFIIQPNSGLTNPILAGPKWGKFYVGPVQFLVCYGAVVASTLLGGQCLKAIYVLVNPNGDMKLYEFVIIFGGLMLILAQMPSFHSLRHINLVSLVLCLAYSACATAGSIYLGNSSKGPNKNYSLSGGTETKVFGIFNSLAIIATTYGNGIIPEIQATLAPPVKGKMFKGLSVCYSVVTLTFFTVGISGYWAFGNEAESLILSNFSDNGKALLPKWFIFMTNTFTILQLSAVAVVYLQPTNEVLESTFADPKSSEFSVRNIVPRVILRSISVVISTTIAAMLPFFGDVNALLGAFGFMPLDFVLPVVFFNLTFKPSKRSPIFWLNVTIAVVFGTLGVIGAVAAVRQISLDAKNYRLFANV